jgi:7-carboxy-7-deazaguanine synthase (Cx14CxxC type)
MAGRASVFCRFSGCNLWNGKDDSRTNAICKFCDTDFVGTDGLNGGKYSAVDLANFIKNIWDNSSSNPSMQNKPYVVLTGGEPLLQVDTELVNELHKHGFEIAVETNGTQKIVEGIDWVCVSPKFGSELIVKSGNEIKVIYPQGFSIDDMQYFASLDFKHFFVQAKDEVKDKDLIQQNLKQAIDFCLDNTKWRLSVQTHKYLGIA